MPIRFFCPLGHRLVVPDNRAGKKGRCPECHQKVYVPVADPQPGDRRGDGRQPAPPPGEEIELDQLIESVLELLPAPERASGEAPALHSPAAGRSPVVEVTDDDDGDDIELCDTPGPEIDAYSNPSLQLPPAALPPASKQQSPEPAASPPQSARSPRPAPVPIPVPQPTAAAAPMRPAAPIPLGPRPSAQPSPYAPAAPIPIPAAPSPAMSYAAPMPAPNGPANEVFIGAMQPVRNQAWIRVATPETVQQGSRPHAGNLQWVYVLAGLLLLVALFGAWPGLMNFSQPEHALWTRIVVGMAAWQLIYVVWLLTVPDWSTLRVGMFLCAACAALYAGALALVVSTPLSEPVRLGLNAWRNTAGGWSAANLFVLGGSCYAFGHFATRWRREAWRRAA